PREAEIAAPDCAPGNRNAKPPSSARSPTPDENSRRPSPRGAAPPNRPRPSGAGRTTPKPGRSDESPDRTGSPSPADPIPASGRGLSDGNGRSGIRTGKVHPGNRIPPGGAR